MTTFAAGARTTRLRDAFPDGVAHVRQLVEFGIPERTVYNRCLDGGPWQRVLPGIILLQTGPPTQEQLVRSALLLGGPGAMVSGVEACRRHGLRRGPAGSPSSTIQILVPSGRQLRSVGHVHVERTTFLPKPVIRSGVPLAPLARACSDAVRRMRSVGEITELLSDAVQRQLCTIAHLSTELDKGSRRGTATPRAVLRQLSAGVRSAAEAAARKTWMSSGLPDAVWNAGVYDARGRLVAKVDCWVDDVAMAWEIESTEWHMGPAEHDRTVERAASMVATGIVYTATKPSRMVKDPRGVAATLRATYAQAAARPRPALTAKPAPG